MPTNENRYRIFYNSGFTLAEVLVVLAILGILAGIAVPSVMRNIIKAEVDICNVNRLQLERMYDTHLSVGSIDHSETVFEQYLQEYGEEICSDHVEIGYDDDGIECTIHSDSDSEGQDDGDGSVSFL